MKLFPGQMFLLLLILSVPPAVYGENILEYLEGEVIIKRNQEELEGDFGMDLMEGDIVFTSDSSLAILSMDGGRVVKLRENSSLKLENLSRNTSLELTKGGVFSRVDHIINGQFEIRTESVVAGVRGTEFFISFGRTVDETPDIWLCVNDGTVEVALQETGESVLVNEGEGINIPGGLKLTTPEFYEWTKELNWNTDPAEGDVRDETNLDGAYADLLDQDYF